jgi:hypothetical protein
MTEVKITKNFLHIKNEDLQLIIRLDEIIKVEVLDYSIVRIRLRNGKDEDLLLGSPESTSEFFTILSSRLD